MTAERQSNMEVRTKQRWVIEFLHAKKIAPNDIHRRLLNVYGDQTVDVSKVRQWVAHFSSGNSDVQDKPRSKRPCTAVTPRNEERLDQLICAIWRIRTRELCTELNIGFNALETMVATLEYRKVLCQVGPHELSHRNIKNTVRKVVGTYWTNTRLKVTVSWIASSLVTEMWCHHYEQESKQQSMERQHVNSPSKKKFKTLPSVEVMWCALSFGIGKGRSFWISLNLDKPSTPTATLRRWLSPEGSNFQSGQTRRQPFSCNIITSGPIPVWRLWSTLSILAGLSYHTHRIIRIWRDLTSICSGRWKMDCVGNTFLATTPSYELWNSGPPPLVQIFTSVACRLLFIAGESA